MERFILYIAGLSGLLLLISLTFTILNTVTYPEKNYIKGDKRIVIIKIVQKIYECKKQGENKRYSFVCEKIKFESNEEIYANDILNRIDPSKIKKSEIVVEDLGKSGEMIIRFEKNKIYVNKIW